MGGGLGLIGVFVALIGILGVAVEVRNIVCDRTNVTGAIFFGIIMVAGFGITLYSNYKDTLPKETAETTIETITDLRTDEELAAKMNWQNAKKDGFAFYLDGQEIDPETVDYTQYDISYDNANQKVYMTYKQPEVHVNSSSGHDTSYVPIVIPVG